MDILIFIIIQFVNVILSTIKSVVTVNGGKMSASIVNSVSYTFGAVITKLITKQSFETVIIVTLLSNLIGVYIGKWIIEKTKKERQWTITATLRGSNKDGVEGGLRHRNIQFTLMPAENDRYLINIYSRSKGESAMIKEILDGENARYSIVENNIPAL